MPPVARSGRGNRSTAGPGRVGLAVDAGDESLSASRVVLALPAPGGAALLATAVPDAPDGCLQAPITRVAIVTLVIDDHRLDSAPRGTGVLVAAGVDGCGPRR